MTTYTRIYANNAKTTLASPANPADTSLIVADASTFPAIGPYEFFTITLDTGTAVEIVEVHGITGNVFTGCVRGMEGTAAQSFLTGTRIENRVTADTLTSFARLIDRVADIASVDQLDIPEASPSNSYLCASPDDGGTPILAVKAGELWRFANHPTIALSGSVVSNGGTNSMPLANANTLIPVTSPGSHIIQFTTGNNTGRARIIQLADSSSISWTGPLPYTVNTLDEFDIYESTCFSVVNLKSTSDDALIFSILFGE